MLVLSRSPDQGVMIGANLEVFVISVRGDRVRLGFRVPVEIPVHRKEIAEQIISEGGQLPVLGPIIPTRLAG